MNYTIRYQCTNDNGSVSLWNAFASDDSPYDMSEALKQDYSEMHKDDPNYRLVDIVRQSIGEIDYDLIERMRATRDMCELGNKVRAEVKIRNRQPLATAYVLFAKQSVHNYMLYVDNKNDEYVGIISDELNVDNVIFITDTNQFTDINLKPNFRVLGKRGFGKQAQLLKTALVSLSATEKRALHASLEKQELVSMSGIDLVLSDLEVEFVSKPGFASASNKTGVIVLDTTLTPELLARGWLADFKSALQNLRKEIGLNLTDRVFIEVWAPNKERELISKHLPKLKKELLANDIALYAPDQPVVNNLDQTPPTRIVIESAECYARIWKE